MDLDEIIRKVDTEKIYQHILQIEGIKHPFINPEKLNATAEYIKNQFEGYNLSCYEQEFQVESFDMTFKNIEGFFPYDENSSKPEILITSHYDTVANSPGANDNGTGIAVMLEAARVISEEKIPVNIRFVSFTLEEANPSLAFNIYTKAQEFGLMDEKYRYTSSRMLSLMRKYQRLYWQALLKYHTSQEIRKYVFDQLGEHLSNEERKFFDYSLSLVEHFTPLSWVGQSALVGSSFWVNKALEDKRNILGVINVETVGYTSKKAHSQFLPSNLFKLFPKYKTKIRKEIGDFIAIASDRQSIKLAKEFCKHCKRKGLELPYVSLRMPFNYQTIALRFRDILRSDHAPFWREGIPALMLTDTANFRYPFYHTEADTIDKLDFNFITKVCQATILTALTFNKE